MSGSTKSWSTTLQNASIIIKDVVELCDPLWRDMDDYEKKRYLRLVKHSIKYFLIVILAHKYSPLLLKFKWQTLSIFRAGDWSAALVSIGSGVFPQAAQAPALHFSPSGSGYWFFFNQLQLLHRIIYQLRLLTIGQVWKNIFSLLKIQKKIWLLCYCWNGSDSYFCFFFKRLWASSVSKGPKTCGSGSPTF